jgi:hypothetical protein
MHPNTQKNKNKKNKKNRSQPNSFKPQHSVKKRTPKGNNKINRGRFPKPREHKKDYIRKNETRRWFGCRFLSGGGCRHHLEDGDAIVLSQLGVHALNLFPPEQRELLPEAACRRDEIQRRWQNGGVGIRIRVVGG